MAPLFYVGLILLAFSVLIAIRVPEPTPFQAYIFRGLFAFSGAAITSEVPGFFEVESGAVRAGGALGVFAALYLLNPPKLIQSATHRRRETPLLRKKSTQPSSVEVAARLSSAKATELLAEADRLRMSGPSYRARQNYESAIELFKQVQSRLGEANALVGLGDLGRLLGRHEPARKAYGEAIELYKQEQDRLGEANALRGLGDLERLLGRHEPARKAYGEAIELHKQEQDRLGEANALRGLGYLEANKSHELAKRYFSDAAYLYMAMGLDDLKEEAFSEAQKLDQQKSST